MNYPPKDFDAQYLASIKAGNGEKSIPAMSPSTDHHTLDESAGSTEHSISGYRAASEFSLNASEDQFVTARDDEEDFDDEIHEKDKEIDFIEDDELEAQLALEELLRDSEEFNAPIQDTLAERLRLDPDGNFPVSAYSLYCENTWVLFKDGWGIATKILFNQPNEHRAALKKALAWHFLPENSPFHNTRSYSTSIFNIKAFSLLSRYVLEPNFLSGDPESLQIINSRMLDVSLDKLKDEGYQKFSELFRILKTWSTLSSQNLLPKNLHLGVGLECINTTERRKQVAHAFTGRLSSWIPFTESELGKLLDYACFWTEKALPCLLRANAFIIDNRLDTYRKKCVSRGKPDPLIEQELNIEIEGRTVMKTTCKDETVLRNGRPERSVSYWWAKSYADGLDHVRNAVFILIGILTGLRASEIRMIKFDDVYADRDAPKDYVLRVTRYKTAKDPNFGEVDELPLPHFLAQRILELKNLRVITISQDNPYVFRSGKSFGRSHPKQSTTTKSIGKIISQIELHTGVDRIHVHRFRKTIAEILINRNERNIDIIRLLFGHKSYTMTLKYIGRNPYLVRTVATAIEQNYAAEFADLITAIQTGTSSGPGAERLLERINANKGAFEGRHLRLTILTYVSHLLSSGQPLFIHRTAVGSFCVSTQTYSSPNLPPCLVHRKGNVQGLPPNPSSCDPSCEHAVIVQKAQRAMKDNIKFYTNILEKGGNSLSDKSRKAILEKISSNTNHLNKLSQQAELIPALEVHV